LEGNAAPRYRPEIDGLRAIAVTSVILFHMGLRAFSGGYVGVDVFFVISGYLIVGIVWRDCERGAFRFGEFYRRRVLRLFPALLLVSVAMLIAGLVILLPTDLARMGRGLTTTMAYVSNVWLWRNTGYFDPAADTLPFLHTWSLSVEEQFYMVMPGALWLVHRFARRHAVLVFALVGVVTFALTQALLVSRQSAVFYLTPFRAWEFLIGGVLAVTGWSPAHPAARAGARWAGLALVVAPVFAYSPLTDFPGVTALAPCVGAGLLLSNVTGENDPVSRFLRSAPMVAIGKISYSLYLWHWPVLVFWAHIEGPPESPLKLAIALVMIVAASWGSFQWVETPLRHGDAPWARKVLVGSLATSGVLLAVGLGLSASGGLPQRVAPEIAALDRARVPVVPFVECFGPKLNGPDCRLGARDKPPTWLLWGDSHSLALAPALDTTLRQRGESAVFIGSGTCPPLFGIKSRDVRTGSWRCDETSARAAAALREHPSIVGVVLVAIWPDYFSEQASCRLSDERGEIGNTAVMRAALSATLTILGKDRRGVVLVGRVPRHHWSVPYELARTRRWGLPMPAAWTASEEREAQSVFLTELRPVAEGKRAGELELVDLVQHFCGEGPCRVTEGEQPLYRDAHHLSVLGAHDAMKSVEPAMTRLLEAHGIPNTPRD
jgi:peptidoglycan/LPS O-acetylase OafA/YrhL